MRLLLSIVLTFAAAHASAVNLTSVESQRDRRFFSLFSVVQFPNNQCTSTSDDTMLGTCKTATECSDLGGNAQGNCASGFGVCCVVTLQTCGGTVTQNCTYIQNSGFPTGDATNQACSFTLNRIESNICQIRLDFQNLVLTGPPNTGVCATSGDTLVVTSPTADNPPSNICGTLTGQHMYFETGTTGDAGTLAITTSIATTARTYNIKVSYIECFSLSRAPAGCVQYFTGSSTTFSTYNHQGSQQLLTQDYSFCFRQEEGFCSYQVREAVGGAVDAFDLEGTAGMVVTTCANNWIAFPSSHIKTPTSTTFAEYGNQRCDTIFAAHAGDTTPGVVESDPGAPFVIQYYVDAATTIAMTIGFELDISQVPC